MCWYEKHAFLADYNAIYIFDNAKIIIEIIFIITRKSYKKLILSEKKHSQNFSQLNIKNCGSFFVSYPVIVIVFRFFSHSLYHTFRCNLRTMDSSNIVIPFDFPFAILGKAISIFKVSSYHLNVFL